MTKCKISSLTVLCVLNVQARTGLQWVAEWWCKQSCRGCKTEAKHCLICDINPGAQRSAWAWLTFITVARRNFITAGSDIKVIGRWWHQSIPSHRSSGGGRKKLSLTSSAATNEITSSCQICTYSISAHVNCRHQLAAALLGRVMSSFDCHRHGRNDIHSGLGCTLSSRETTCDCF